MVTTTDKVRNAMTVDVEDYFHADAVDTLAPQAAWAHMPCRIERNIDVVLALLDQHQVRATFFTLGWIARRYPAMVRAIDAAGHEIASHGYTHQKASRQSRVQFRRDAIRSKGVLEDLVGDAVIGYRAPACSVGPEHRWALDTLYHAGYRYSSSSYPLLRRQRADAPRFACFPAGASGILELPRSTARVLGYNLPAGGGASFRLLPYPLSRALLRSVNRIDRQPAIFGFSAWEVDAGQPRIAGLPPGARLLHYLNLGRTEPRLLALTREFRWGRIDEVFPMLPGVSEPVFRSQLRPRWQGFSRSDAAVQPVRSRS
ncbi:XrtA system polysaccharide deacetylase [Massilia sp. GCM10020059]|uniref:DUF3473 domain-containing protein n=1 Tax=Massilia agrisoli TaxID=2892444 RepID=A0ABS8IRM6_9BURK|nr:XrtA system polysaccharide deacetylase [Massilia agrisoli]MCC6070853.1 DUF3473 domain-containing protein [Massilia agrisoli]